MKSRQIFQIGLAIIVVLGLVPWLYPIPVPENLGGLELARKIIQTVLIFGVGLVGLTILIKPAKKSEEEEKEALLKKAQIHSSYIKLDELTKKLFELASQAQKGDEKARQAILDLASLEAKQLAGAVLVDLRLLDKSKKKLTLASFSDEPVANLWADKDQKIQKTYLERVVKHGEQMYVPDILEDPLYKNNQLINLGIQSLVVIPLVNYQEKVLGTITLYFKDLREYQIESNAVSLLASLVADLISK